MRDINLHALLIFSHILSILRGLPAIEPSKLSMNKKLNTKLSKDLIWCAVYDFKIVPHNIHLTNLAAVHLKNMFKVLETFAI